MSSADAGVAAAVVHIDTSKALSSQDVRNIFISAGSVHEAPLVGNRPRGGDVKIYGADIVAHRDYVADGYPWNFSYRSYIKDPSNPAAPPILIKIVHVLRIGVHDPKTKRAPSDRTFQRHIWTILGGSSDPDLLEHKERAIVHYVGKEPVRYVFISGSPLCTFRLFSFSIQPDGFGLKHGNSRIDVPFTSAMPSTRTNAATSVSSVDTTFAALCQAAPAENYMPRNKKFCMNSRVLYQRRLLDEEADEDQEALGSDENNDSFEDDDGVTGGDVEGGCQVDGNCGIDKPSANDGKDADDDDNAADELFRDDLIDAGFWNGGVVDEPASE